MRYIDLHVHSTASDGTLTPSEVVRLAAEKGLEAIALTDHDTVGGVREALEAAEGLPLTVIPGIELSCVWEKTEIHILGLFVDIHNPNFLSEIHRLLDIREARNDEILRRFRQAGIDLTREELTHGSPGTVLTRAHFARALVEKGVSPSMDKAFKQFLQYGGPYCIRKEGVPPEKALKILTESGAFPTLAHPCQYKLGKDRLRALLALLKELGLQGLEVYHSSNNQHESGQLKILSRSYGLLPTGGSDFHGAAKPDIGLGTGRGGLRVSGLLLDDILASRKKQPAAPHTAGCPG